MSPEHSDTDSLLMNSPVDTKPLIEPAVGHHKENDMWVPQSTRLFFFNMSLVWLMFLSLFLSLRFRTPNICRSILESTPRTPTPFRSALAQQEAKYGLLKVQARTTKNIHIQSHHVGLKLTLKFDFCFNRISLWISIWSTPSSRSRWSAPSSSLLWRR